MEIREFSLKIDAEKWLESQKGIQKYIAQRKKGGFVAVLVE